MCSIHSGAAICAGSRAAIRLRVGMRDRLSRRIGVGALISGIHCRRLGRPPTGVGVALRPHFWLLPGLVRCRRKTRPGRGRDCSTTWKRRANWVPAAHRERGRSFQRRRPRQDDLLRPIPTSPYRRCRFTEFEATLSIFANVQTLTVTGAGVISSRTADRNSMSTARSDLPERKQCWIGPNVDELCIQAFSSW